MKYFLFLVFLLFLNVNGIHRKYSRREQRLRFLNFIKDQFHNHAAESDFDIRHFDKEEMILYPDVGFQSIQSPDQWILCVHGWRYETSRKHSWLSFSASKWLQRIASQLVNNNEILYLNGSINRDRLKPFFVDDESNEFIRIIIGSQTYSARTDRQGQFYDEFSMPDQQVQILRENSEHKNILSYEAIGDNQDKIKGFIYLMDPQEGISVISDIDDTIKVSEVLDKIRLLANTFIHPFKAVPGMADLYQKWNSKHANVTFHYLSGMPDQLFTLTNEFILDNNFPIGSYHMRHFGWAATSIFNFLHSESTKNHKLSYLRFFFENTKRDYVLVGDSGEKDPEIYATIAREYPQRIRAIFIRAIKGESFTDGRFVDVFRDIPEEKWQIFNDPEQLPLDLSKPPRSNTTNV